MRQNIKPVANINNKIDDIVNKYTNGFHILHIRSGDDTLINNIDNSSDNFYSIINSNLNTISSLPVIVISDSIKIREELNKLYGFNITGCEVAHSGKVNTDLEGTVIEFFLMSRSRKIFSLSIYEWGSTFSTMCAAIYNVPLIKLT
jgi:hypothetical protein